MTSPGADIVCIDQPGALDRAESVLRAGGCVAVPTETVYGLACDASNARAVAGVYATKGRPSFNPLIAHVDSLERAQSLIELSPKALKLANAFWPGPLTLVAPIKPAAPVCDLVTAGLQTLAVRWPNAKAMTELVGRLDRPLAAPSANASGAISPTTAQHVMHSLGRKLQLILDDGPAQMGLESTIITVDGNSVSQLRPGGITRDSIEQAINDKLIAPSANGDQPNAPGQLKSHYAPKAAVRLNVTTPESDEGYLEFGAPYKGPCAHRYNLSESSDLIEAATKLFSGLHKLDSQVKRIAVSPIPDTGLGEAINDRLHRAAAQRS